MVKIMITVKMNRDHLQDEINNMQMNRNLNRAYVPLKTWDSSDDKSWWNKNSTRRILLIKL